MLNNRRRSVLLLMIVTLAVSGCSSATSRTQKHAGINVKLNSIARVSVYEAGMQQARAKSPDHEIAVVQLEFSPADQTNLKLPAADVQLTDSDGKSYNSDADLEFNLGSSERVMVWDITFAVPKTASLKSLRVGTAEFDLGGTKDLDPAARVTPGSHPAKK